jgi:DNA-binding NtrC family response regulator
MTHPEQETTRLADAARAQTGDADGEARVSVILHHRDGAAIVALVPGQPVVIGRLAPSDVIVPDASLSRQHARVGLDQGAVVIEDLGSTNGTRVGGQAIERATIRPGDEVELGAVTLSLHVVGGGAASRELEPHDRLRAALDREVARARYFGRSVALVLLRAASPRERGWVHRWLPRLEPLLRPIDSAALYGPDAIEVALPETSTSEAQALVRRLAATGAPGESPLLAGVAAFPEVARGAEELIERARRAALEATAESPLRVAGPDDARAPTGAALELEATAQSAAMREVIATALRLARGTIPVLVQGETGSGKEVLARFLHERGRRRDGPMVTLNCAAIPTELVESTLFGHDKGAFTGATQAKKGAFEAAHGGTVLLDEIGDLPLAAQAALLRVLESKRVVRVGGTREIDVDVRVIAASHRDLEQLVRAGRFREDLLYRLNGMTLHVPPLRERREEIVPLAARFLSVAARETESTVRELEPEALALIEAYGWPGNVRELRNAIERAVVLAEGESVTADDLPAAVRAGRAERPDQELNDEGDGADFRTRVEAFEMRLISDALRDSRGNQTEAARRLRMPLRTLANKVKAFGLRPSR